MMSNSNGDTGLVQAIEEAVSEETTTQSESMDLNGQSELTVDEREIMTRELHKTEEDIAALRQVMQARMKHASELRHKLGISPWQEITSNVSQSYKHVKESQVYHKTEDLLKDVGSKTTNAFSVVGKKLGEMRGTETFKSFEAGMGNAYSNVKRSYSKTKIAGSTSMMGFGPGPSHENGFENNAKSAPSSQPTTPS